MFNTFGLWLQEQQERKDAVGELARLTWLSFTSGDCPYHSHALEWRDHYKKTLPEYKFILVMDMLKESFAAYAYEVLRIDEAGNMP